MLTAVVFPLAESIGGCYHRSMAYSVISKKSGKTYYLHARLQKLKGGKEVTLYYFGGEAKEGAIDELPEGYVVSENSRTGLPLLKKG